LYQRERGAYERSASELHPKRPSMSPTRLVLVDADTLHRWGVDLIRTFEEPHLEGHVRAWVLELLHALHNSRTSTSKGHRLKPRAVVCAMLKDLEARPLERAACLAAAQLGLRSRELEDFMEFALCSIERAK
jgi:hypothetical protein